jgi:prepilin-type processing-associated H-X9-DG protein
VVGYTFKFQDKVKPSNCGVAASPHTGGINIALADGSARNVAPEVSPAVWFALHTTARGEALGDY